MSLKEVAMRLQGSCNVPKSQKTRWDHAKSRSGKSKTKAQGRPNWRHRAAAVLEAKMQEELRAEWAEMQEARRLEMLDFGFRMYRAGWEACAAGSDFVLGWDSAKRRNPL